MTVLTGMRPTAPSGIKWRSTLTILSIWVSRVVTHLKKAKNNVLFFRNWHEVLDSIRCQIKYCQLPKRNRWRFGDWRRHFSTWLQVNIKTNNIDYYYLRVNYSWGTPFQKVVRSSFNNDFNLYNFSSNDKNNNVNFNNDNRSNKRWWSKSGVEYKIVKGYSLHKFRSIRRVWLRFWTKLVRMGASRAVWQVQFQSSHRRRNRIKWQWENAKKAIHTITNSFYHSFKTQAWLGQPSTGTTTIGGIS